MNTLLNDIVRQKQEEVAALRAQGLPPFEDPGPFRDFRKAVSEFGKINLIAEIKYASPSVGWIGGNRDTIRIGRIYETAGAAALSLLTDRRFFRGDIDDLPRLKQSVSLPVLRKDFILDEIQLRESARYGADAVLLIARLLSARRLSRLLHTCREMGIAALTEVHDRRDLDKALNGGAEIIGINNRDLDSFEVRLETTPILAALVPEDRVLVSESGIRCDHDIHALKNLGVHAVLVGTGLMESADLPGTTRALVAAGSRSHG
jgi:indole-3-glycerol phosphate synthase